jgi:O-antigen ligase
MARRILDAVSTVFAGHAKAYMKGHVMVAFLLFLALPLLRIRSIPAFSGTWFLVHCVSFAAGLSGLLFLARRGGSARLRLSAIDILAAGFYALYLVAAALSDNMELSFIELSGEIFMMALYVYFRVVMEGPSRGNFIEKLSFFAALAAAGLSLWGLAQYFFEVDVPRGLKLLFKTHHFPVVASMGNPNFLAETIVLFMLPALGFLSSRKSPVPLVAGAFIMGLAVFLTYSRLAWFAMALALLLVLAAAGREGRRRIITAVVAVVIGTGAFFVHHQNTGSTRSERVLRSFDLSGGSPLTERRVIYSAGLSMLGDAGLFGMGPGMFGYRYLDYQGRALRSFADSPAEGLPVDLDHAHNDLIETGVDLGYAALVFFVLLLGAGAAAGARSLARPRAEGHRAHLELVPIVYIPFCLWSFPFHLPFSKIILLLSLAFIASRGRVIAGGEIRFRAVAPFLALLLAVFMVVETRHALSVFHYDRGLSYFSRDFEKSFEHFRRGVECYPYNGYNYFSMGALLLNRGRNEGIGFLEESMKYFSNSTTRLYLARGNRDHGRVGEAVRWYENLLFVRPDIRKAREEYREILDGDGGG